MRTHSSELERSLLPSKDKFTHFIKKSFNDLTNRVTAVNFFHFDNLSESCDAMMTAVELLEAVRVIPNSSDL